MTNKTIQMPTIGKIYKTIKGKVHVGHEYSEVLGVAKGLVWYKPDPKECQYYDYFTYTDTITIDRFWKEHEKQAEDNKKESKKTSEVDAALKNAIKSLKNGKIHIEELKLLLKK